MVTSSEQGPREAPTPGWAWAVVVLAPLLLFASVLGHDFVNWDDRIYIEGNRLVTDPASATVWERLATPALGYPLPLPVLLYGWLWALGEGTAWPFHALNLAVHVSNTLLLFALLRRDLPPGDDRSTVALVASLGFAVHPVVVEPVAWVTGLKDLLFGTGALLAVHAVTSRREGWSPFAALLAYASKPASALLGLAMPWFHVGRAHLGPPQRLRTAVPLAATALVGLALVAFTFMQESPELRTTVDGPTSALRILGAAGVSVRHLLAPASLVPIYPLASVGAADIVLGVLALVGLGIAALAAVRSRSPATGWLALLVCAYLPVSNLQPLLRFTADSYLYVPWIAGAAALAHGWCHLQGPLRRRSERAHGLVRRLVLVVVPAWGLLAFVQVGVWRDSTTLWGEVHAAYPDDGEVVYRYGDALGRAGDLQAELSLYDDNAAALARAPKIPVALVAILEKSGQLDAADEWYGHAFASEVEQDEALYRHYAAYVARHPSRHRSIHDPDLRHAISRLLAQPDGIELHPAEQARLSSFARRLGLPADTDRPIP